MRECSPIGKEREGQEGSSPSNIWPTDSDFIGSHVIECSTSRGAFYYIERRTLLLEQHAHQLDQDWGSPYSAEPTTACAALKTYQRASELWSAGMETCQATHEQTCIRSGHDILERRCLQAMEANPEVLVLWKAIPAGPRGFANSLRPTVVYATMG